MTTDARVRWSCGSRLVQTGQWHPIMGTPALVPLPRKSNSTEDIGVRYSGSGRLVNGRTPNPRATYAARRGAGRGEGAGFAGAASFVPVGLRGPDGACDISPAPGKNRLSL